MASDNPVVEEKTNLKDSIIQSACDLFMQHGFSGTSIKQIAKSAGCTTAALYYYFEDGKNEILKAVIDDAVSGEFLPVVDHVKGKDSLEEALVAFGKGMAAEAPKMVQRINWVMLEFDHLDDEIKEVIQANQMKFHRILHDEISRFIPDAEAAKITAWIAQFCYIGYAQFTTKFHPNDFDLDLETFSHTLAQVLCKSVE